MSSASRDHVALNSRRSCLTWVGAGTAVSALSACSSMPWSTPSKPQPKALPAVPNNPLRSAWRVQVGANPVGLPGFVPVLGGESVLAAAPTGQVVSVQAASGALRWQVALGKPLSTGVGSDGQVHVVCTRDAQLVALDNAGKTLWTSPLGAAGASVPVVGLDTVLVRTVDGRIQAFEASSGKRRWQASRPAPALVLQQTAAIAISPSLVYVGLPGGRLLALTLSSGAVRWEAAVALPKGANEIERIADVSGSPLVSDTMVCAASFQGRVACFDAATGRALWAQPVSTASGLELDGRFVVVVDDSDRVQAFSRDGVSAWKNEALRLRLLTGALSIGRYLLLGDGAGLVHALDRDSGAVVGRISTDGSPILNAPVAAGRIAVVQSRSGALFGVSVE